MKTKVITFWSPVKRQGGCSTNVALYASYLSHVMNETEKAVVFSLNEGIDSSDYLTLNSIKNGSKDLLFLNELNNIKSKEDVLAYTHKLSENLDILGTGKDVEIILKKDIEIIEILSKAYDYIIIDSITDNISDSLLIFDISDLIIVCVPQDRFVYERLDMSLFKNKKVIFLSSMYNEKNDLNLNKLQSMVPVQVYPLSRDNKINQAVSKQEVYSFINYEFKRKSLVIDELGSLNNEIQRLININNLNITYEIRKNKEVSVDVKEQESETKIIREYKFIKTKNNIAVINLSKGAGSTFISLNLAYMLKDKKVDVSVVDLPCKDMKDDIFYIISESYDATNRKKSITKNGIKFYVNNNEKVCNWSKEESIEYISMISKEGNINIYDVGSLELDESIGFLFSILDVAIIIIDPIPYQLLQAEERIELIKRLEDKNIKIVYVLNKYVKDLNKKDIEKYLNIEISSCVPFISPEILYAAYYSNQTAYQLEKSDFFHDGLQRILSMANVLEYENRKDNRKFKLFKWR